MNIPPDAPRRRATDHHVHPEYWTEVEQHRFEDRVSRELRGIRQDLRADIQGTQAEVRQLATRLLLMLGAIALLGFLIPIVAPILIESLR